MERLLFVGTYTEPIRFGTGKILEGKGEGIYVWRFDPDGGRFEFAALSRGMKNPSYLAVSADRRFLYAVEELKGSEGRPGGTACAFALDAGTGVLRPLNSRSSEGADPCFAALDPSGRFLAVANYSSGSVAVYPLLADGGLGPASALVRHAGSSIDPARQAGPHAHSAFFGPDGGHLFVPDLGIDEVVVYEFDAAAGTLRRDEGLSAVARPGSGPRHLAFHPSGGFVYVLGELDSSVSVWAFAPGGVLSPLQSVSTLPSGSGGGNLGADIHLSPSGRFLYASNRGHDSIAAFAVDEASGLLSPLGWTSTRGRTPRSFALDSGGRWLVVANQDTDNLVLFALDPGNGLLEYAGAELAAPTPVCVKFA